MNPGSATSAAAAAASPSIGHSASSAPLGPRYLRTAAPPGGPVNVAATVAGDKAQRRMGCRNGAFKQAPAEADSNCSLCAAAGMLRWLKNDLTWNSQTVATGANSGKQDPCVFVRYYKARTSRMLNDERQRRAGNPAEAAKVDTDDRWDVETQFQGLLAFVTTQTGQLSVDCLNHVTVDGLKEKLSELDEGEYVLGVSMRDSGHWNMAHYERKGDSESLTFYDYQTNVDNQTEPVRSPLPIEPKLRQGSPNEHMDIMIFRRSPDGETATGDGSSSSSAAAAAAAAATPPPSTGSTDV